MDESEEEVGLTHGQENPGSAEHREGRASRSQRRSNRRLDPAESHSGPRRAAGPVSGEFLVPSGSDAAIYGEVSGEVQDPLVPLSDVPRGVRQTLHIGPLPAPQDLARYGEVSPDLVDRIVVMAEVELEARAHVLKTTADAEGFAVKASALAVLFLPFAGLLAGVALVLFGAGPWAAGIVGASGIILTGLAKVIAAWRGRPTVEDDSDE